MNNFCESCGSKLVEHLTQRFNKETGEQITSKHCPNLKCIDGCEYEGHKWGSFFKFQHPNCQRCGSGRYTYDFR